MVDHTLDVSIMSYIAAYGGSIVSLLARALNKLGPRYLVDLESRRAKVFQQCFWLCWTFEISHIHQMHLSQTRPVWDCHRTADQLGVARGINVGIYVLVCPSYDLSNSRRPPGPTWTGLGRFERALRVLDHREHADITQLLELANDGQARETFTVDLISTCEFPSIANPTPMLFKCSAKVSQPHFQ